VPVYATVIPDKEDWFIETSVTVGLQAPLRSINKERLVSAGFSLGKALGKSPEDGYAWVSFCRWTPNERYGMEQHVDDEYQLVFTRFGVAVVKNWDDIFVPSSQQQADRPVLIYDYDSFCFLFCDAGHFISESEAWTVFADAFGVAPPPNAKPAPKGHFAKISTYMALHDHGTDNDGEPIRPHFHN